MNYPAVRISGDLLGGFEERKALKAARSDEPKNRANFKHASAPYKAFRPASQLCLSAQGLVTGHRQSAQNIGFQFMRRWGARLERDCIISAVDFGLCRAARRYQSSRGVDFITFAHFFIKAELINEISRQKKIQVAIEELRMHRGRQKEALEAEYLQPRPASPDEALLQVERREILQQAISLLSSLERKIFELTVIDQLPVTAAAVLLGYSRGHLSLVKTRALTKIKTGLKKLLGEDSP